MFRTRLPLVASLISAIFISSLLPTNGASASTPEFSNCLLPASKVNAVSLGQPLAIERLAQKTNLRIGVLPFYFNNSPEKLLTESQKSDYLNAAKTLGKLSNGKVSVEIVFLDSFKLDKPAETIKQAYLDRGLAWSEQQTTKGTWGLVREVITTADPVRNYSNLDGVILETNNPDQSYFISEAMGFFAGSQGNVYRDSDKVFFKSILTQEGAINNAVLLDVHKGESTIVHELLHNFGLTDLYGSGAGPADLSIMAAGSNKLLNYEKAVLGWFPLENFKCINLYEVLKTDSVDNILEISNFRTDSISLLKKSEDTAYLLETINSGNETLLVVYLLEQDRRPPLTVSYNPKLTYPSFYNIRDLNSIGSKYRTEDFEVLLTDIKDSSISLNLIPTKLANSADAQILFEKSISNRDQAKAKADAEAKAKADAEAKTDAEAKAKADAEAKAKLSVKKTTIICVKGKTSKKVVAEQPKCPAGYKLKK